MQTTTDSRVQSTAAARGGWAYRFFWGKLSRPLRLLAVLLIGTAAATAFSLTGNPQADWAAFAFALSSIVVITAVLRRVRQRLRFVKHLSDWAERMRGGDLDTKIPMSREPDLADVIEDINSLGGMLQKLAMQADVQSRAQTVRLARKTQSLDILYDVAQSLTRPGTLDQQLESFLDTFIELIDARAATVHLLDAQGGMRLIASRHFDVATSDAGATLSTHCGHCGWEIGSGALHILTDRLACAKQAPLESGADRHEVVVVPVQYQGRTLGIYTLYLDWPASVLGEDALQLLTSIARHLALAIEKARLDNDARRLAIMEERNMIGNELHDSLAQALVGMRLQIKMLGETLHKRDVRRAQEEVRRLRTAVEEAHASLRELLSNFRLRIDERGLIPALETMVRRANQEQGLAVFFHNDCDDLRLTPAQEIQIYHIVQEALTNIRKHANARNARIQLASTKDGRYSVLIEDDGDGIAPTEPDRPGEQIGLAIMRQRAERLPGELSVESEPGEGTRIFVTFTGADAEPARQAYGS
jgi:two-component system nitrate/nitrite sensor histidine kinase NarX